MLCLEDDYTAYCLDQAVGHFGDAVTGELDSVEGETKEEIKRNRQAVLDKYFGVDDSTPSSGRFADPMSMFAG